MSTIGEQRKFNYALQPMTREAFITMMTTDLPEVPAYFAADSEINRTGTAALGFSEVQRFRQNQSRNRSIGAASSWT